MPNPTPDLAAVRQAAERLYDWTLQRGHPDKGRFGINPWNLDDPDIAYAKRDDAGMTLALYALASIPERPGDPITAEWLRECWGWGVSVSMTAGAKGIAVTEPEQILSALSSESATALWSLKMRGCRCAGTCPKCKNALKQAQIAELRQRCEDIMSGAVYAEDAEWSLFQALNDVFRVSIRQEDRPAIEINSAAPDILAAWLWERGVRA